jgi:hypothetical protein
MVEEPHEIAPIVRACGDEVGDPVQDSIKKPCHGSSVLKQIPSDLELEDTNFHSPAAHGNVTAH